MGNWGIVDTSREFLGPTQPTFWTACCLGFTWPWLSFPWLSLLPWMRILLKQQMHFLLRGTGRCFGLQEVFSAKHGWHLSLCSFVSQWQTIKLINQEEENKLKAQVYHLGGQLAKNSIKAASSSSSSPSPTAASMQHTLKFTQVPVSHLATNGPT